VNPVAPLRVRRLDPQATLPVRAHPGDAGLDLHAGLVLPRSGLAARHGVALVNAPGLIDAGYRGELRILLLNTDPTDAFTWAAGERIAQLVLVDVSLVEVVEVSELGASSRGEGGFGSSGH
jgi:dUTP pyrophosphatase